MRSVGIRVLAVASLIPLLTGCATGGSPASVPAPAPTITITETVTVTVTPSLTAPPTTVAPPLSDSSPGAVVPSVAPGSARVLHLNDAQPNSDWREAGYRPVGSTGVVQAIGTTLRCDWSKQIEFRFSQNSGKFAAAVAQDMGSFSSGEQLEWSLIIDGSPVETKIIEFKQAAEFSWELAGVAVVQLLVKSVSKSCQGSATGLITSVTVEG